MNRRELLELQRAHRATVPALEFDLHRWVIQLLHRLRPDGLCFHCPSGEERDARVGHKLRMMGAIPGVADLICVLPGGKVAFLELKVKGKYQSAEQKHFQGLVEGLGAPYAIARTQEEAVAALVGWGVLAGDVLKPVPADGGKAAAPMGVAQGMIYDRLDDLPQGHYGVIVADPPWRYLVFSDKGKGRSADRHYETMTPGEIHALPVGSVARRDCHLILWIPGACLVAGMHLPVMHAWGFKPSSLGWVWLKSKQGTRENGDLFFRLDRSLFVKGMGHTTRQNAEFAVLGRKGSPKRLTKAAHQLIIEPRREHSRKPEASYGDIEAYAAGPYLELFSRTPRAGWDTWGEEARKLAETAGAPREAA